VLGCWGSREVERSRGRSSAGVLGWCSRVWSRCRLVYFIPYHDLSGDMDYRRNSVTLECWGAGVLGWRSRVWSRCRLVYFIPYHDLSGDMDYRRNSVTLESIRHSES
jgi:hypothetical protein